MFLKRNLLVFFLSLALVALLVAACGNNSGTTTGSSPAPTATLAGAPTPTTSGSGAVVQTASATVDGKAVTILTNTKGMTLYYRTSDTTTSVCSGGCAQDWPPLLFSGSGTPASTGQLPGTLSVVKDANGTQVAYQGHPLYTFESDTAPGQTKGEKVAGVWFVATTDLAPGNGGGGGSTTPTPTATGGYGY